MPVVAAPLFGFALGVVYAWAAAADLAREGGTASARSLLIVAMFGALVYAPACGYLSAFFPDWSYAYLVDSEKRPVALDMALLLLDAASAPVGFLSLSKSAAARKSGSVARGALGPALLAVFMILAALGRLRVYATYAQYHGDFGGEPATGSAVGWAVLWMASIVVCASAWTIHLLRRLEEKPRSN